MAKLFFIISFFVYGSIALAIYCYQDSINSDDAMYGEETCLRFVEEDLLGKPIYSETCPRYLYENQVGRHGDDIKNATSFFFTFYPVKGKELSCPAVTILVDRRSGEFWIVDVDKQSPH
jgi:hypothetical protein